MDTTTTNRKPRKARTMRLDCCSDDVCTSGSRNNYFPGKRLTPDSFRAEQNYFIDRRHLLNRAMYGWGVVYGYRITTEEPDKNCPGAELGCLQIGEGLALDKCGRELVQTGPVALTLDSVLLLDRKGALIRSQNCDKKDRFSQLKEDEGTYWLLSVHYAEQDMDSVTLKDACSCERKEWNQVCETVRYSLRPVDRAQCCAEQPCELNCCCATGNCCEEDGGPRREELEKEIESLRTEYTKLSPEDKEKLRTEYESKIEAIEEEISHIAGGPADHGRGGCRCICDHLTKLQVGCDCGSLCQVDACARADLSNAVGLACLKLEPDDCGGWRFASVYDDCGPRRLVKRNDLLFDLIRGCDVTRIVEIGWPWHRKKTPISFDDFAEALGFDENNQSEPEYVTKRFWVRFSQPVREDTLCSDCFAMTVMATETEGGWWQVFRVPIVGVDTSDFHHTGDPAGHVRGATIIVDGGWLIDAVCGRHSIFKAGQTRVELEVRGDFIVDCNGQTVDANPRGLSPVPSGSDGPGDSFLSTFTVDRRETGEPTYKPKPYAQSAEGVKS